MKRSFGWRTLHQRGHEPKARLNIADCAPYALARSLNAPLLFKGNDLIHTDIEPRLRAPISP